MASKKDLLGSAFAGRFRIEWEDTVRELKRYDLSKCRLVPENIRGSVEHFESELREGEE